MTRPSFVPLVSTVVLYGLLVLLFTLVSLYVSPLSSRSGTFRQLGAIPPHLLELAGVALVLGAGVYAISRRLDLVLVMLSVVVLTDLDHLPSALGMIQPIRPAHSILFIAAAVILVATIIKRLDLSFAVMSGFFIHMSIDTGQFPPFSPLSLGYYELGNYVAEFAVLAVTSALVAGFLGRRVR